MYRSDLIRAAKAAKKLTLDDLEKSTGLNKNTISDICNGKETIELPSLQKVCEALNLKLSDVFSQSATLQRVA
jgi:transcriptional regulator with XRE-family HTH domain